MVANGVTQIDLPNCIGDSSRDSKVALPCFVAGPENRLATVALRQWLDLDQPIAKPSLFNPLVLVGPAGCGKSLLARGVAGKFLQLYGDESVEHFSAIDFARQLRAARDEDQLGLFRERLSSLSLLIIEDLRLLPQRAFVQRELRDTIDVLVSAERAVLLTSQQPPSTMLQLDAGLRDRLASGLTVPLRPPGFEARQKILHLAAASHNATLDDDQLETLAKKIDGPAPVLLRALAKLELAADAGQDLPQLHQPIHLKQIIAVVARYYSLTQAAIRGPIRRKSLVHARSVVIHLARKLTDSSYSQIGQSLGRRDHSTILHGHRNIERMLADDLATQEAVEQLQRILTAV